MNRNKNLKKIRKIENWDNQKTENLIKAILTLENISEVKKYFRDLFTEKELIELGNRWEAAQMLDKKTSYLQIEQETGLSSTTIARISKWLNKGTGGYKLALKKLNLHHSNSTQIKRGLS